MGHVSARAGASQSGLPQLDQPSAFLKALGLKFDLIEPARVVGSLDVGPEHHTPWGVVHGGTFTTAIESAASVGASMAVVDRGQFAVGVNNNTDFLRPVVSGRLTLIAEAVHQGATQQLWQVTLSRDDGKLVARGQVRLQNVSLPDSRASTQD
jgi:1,4-dihydroxy-2-naphthoyl-CoA hydrolase